MSIGLAPTLLRERLTDVAEQGGLLGGNRGLSVDANARVRPQRFACLAFEQSDLRAVGGVTLVPCSGVGIDPSTGCGPEGRG